MNPVKTIRRIYEAFSRRDLDAIAGEIARGRGRGSGASVEARGPNVWTFRDGKPIRFNLYQEEVEALQAVGLRE